MPTKEDLREKKAQEERKRTMIATEEALKYGVPVSVLGIAILLVVAFLTPADSLVRSTRVLSVATVGLMLATLALVGVTYWQTNRHLAFEAKRDEERTRREKASRRRQEIARVLSDYFGSTWRAEIQHRIKEDGTHQTREDLRPFGVGLDEIERLFPQLAPAIHRRREKERLRNLRRRDPDAYWEEKARRHKMEEEAMDKAFEERLKDEEG